MYHYHGLPTGLLSARRVAAPDQPLHLLGYAAGTGSRFMVRTALAIRRI